MLRQRSSFSGRCLKNVSQQVLALRGKFFVPAAHNDPSRLKRFFEIIFSESFSTSLGKGRNLLRRETSTEHVTGDTHHSTGVEHGLNSGFRMIAHDEADEERPRVNILTVSEYLHGPIIILQIGVRRASSQIDTLSYV